MTTLPTGSTAVSRPINNRHECQEIQEQASDVGSPEDHQAHIGRSALGTPDGGLGRFVLRTCAHGSVCTTHLRVRILPHAVGDNLSYGPSAAPPWPCGLSVGITGSSIGGAPGSPTSSSCGSLEANSKMLSLANHGAGNMRPATITAQTPVTTVIPSILVFMWQSSLSMTVCYISPNLAVEAPIPHLADQQ